MKFHNSCLLVVTAIFASLLVDREDARAVAGERPSLPDRSRFQNVASPHELPEAVRRLCTESDGRLAAPNEPFNATCTGPLNGPPASRLIWAMHSPADELFVLHYERGGVAHLFNVLIVRQGPHAAKPDVLWAATGKSLKDYDAFVKAMQSGALREVARR
jgi:hypothetical protein